MCRQILIPLIITITVRDIIRGKSASQIPFYRYMNSMASAKLTPHTPEPTGARRLVRSDSGERGFALPSVCADLLAHAQDDSRMAGTLAVRIQYRYSCTIHSES